MTMMAGILFGGGALGVLAALFLHAKERNMLDACGLPGKMQRVRSANDDDEEDDDEEEEDDDDDDDDRDGGDDGDDDVDDMGAVSDSDVEGCGSGLKRSESMKAFVAIADQVHTVVLSLGGIDSWANLSQTIHETCEDNSVPDLPVNGIMHIVLNVKGKTIPVTGTTPIDELWKAKAIKVSITDEEAGPKPAKPSGQKKTKRGSQPKKR